jgi:peptidoglycan hydrolase CwlO-like protein/surface antigen
MKKRNMSSNYIFEILIGGVILKKKQILSLAMISGMILTTAMPAMVTSATDVDSQIATKNSEINDLKSKEAEAQSQVDAVQSKILSLQNKTAKLQEENDTLTKQGQALAKQIDQLNVRITKREKAIQSQARSVQTEGTGANYLQVILDAKSLSDAITRVQAVTKIVSANNDMIKQQKSDREAVQQKSDSNQKAIKVVWDNQKEIESQQSELKTQQAQLKVAQLNLDAERSTKEDEKAALLDKKAEAEAEAKRVADEQAAAAKKQEDQIKAAEDYTSKNGEANAPTIPSTGGNGSSNSNNGGGSSSNGGGSSTDGGGTTPEPTPTPTPGPGGFDPVNTYPAGQCTWFVKSYMPTRVGNNWGNASSWPSAAAAAGISVGSTPAAGAVVVFPPAADNMGYGHVAVVTGVSGGTISIVEGNYLGQTPHSRTVSAAGLTYIYA